MSVGTISATKTEPEAWTISAELRRQLLEALAAPSRPRMTYEALLQHQDISDFLVALLRPFVEQRDLGIVRSAPFQMKLAASGREPDLLFVASAHLDRLHDTHLEGPADLAVEVVSPESAGRDRGEKFYEYAAAGVPEYWLIDPQMQWAEFYRLEGPRYRLSYEGRDGRYESAVVPGFWLRVEWLWQRPRVLDALRELGVIP